jgi:hypothetical protein
MGKKLGRDKNEVSGWDEINKLESESQKMKDHVFII